MSKRGYGYYEQLPIHTLNGLSSRVIGFDVRLSSLYLFRDLDPWNASVLYVHCVLLFSLQIVIWDRIKIRKKC